MRARAWAAAALAVACASAARPAAPQADGALILAPDPGERVDANQVLVAVTLPPGAESAAATLRVGSRDVSAEVERSGRVLTWRPRAPLGAGAHRVVVEARGADGAPLPPVAWTFTVAPAPPPAGGASPPPVATRPPAAGLPHGLVVMEGGGSAASGPGAPFRREEAFAPRLWLTAGGELRPGWRYGVRGTLSGYERADGQSVQRLRAELRAPGVSLALGDVNPVLHDVILAGRRVRGGELSLRAGPAGLRVVAGQSLRAVGGTLDPADGGTVLRRGTYAQSLVAVRPSLRAGGFGVGLTVMRVRDDALSLGELRTAPGDSGTLSANPAPRDNLVAGMDASLRMLRGRVVLEYANAMSLLARDISTRPRTRAELDSLFAEAGADPPGIDPREYDRFFILNASLYPLDPSRLTSTAHQARASVRAAGHTLTAEWSQVGADYVTLGIPGMQGDRRALRVRDSFRLAGDALFLSAGVQQDRDNLDGAAAATTRGRGGFATMVWQAPRGVLVTGAARVDDRGNDLAPGASGARDQRTLALSGGVAVPVGTVAALRTRVSVNGARVTRADPANPLADTRDEYLLLGVEGETASRGTRVAATGGRNRSRFAGLSDGATTFDRLALSGRHRVAPRWTVRLDGGVTAARSPDAAGAPGPRYTRAEAEGGAEFAWRRDAALVLTAGVADYADRRDPARDTRELTLRLRLTRAF